MKISRFYKTKRIHKPASVKNPTPSYKLVHSGFDVCNTLGITGAPSAPGALGIALSGVISAPGAQPEAAADSRMQLLPPAASAGLQLAPSIDTADVTFLGAIGAVVSACAKDGGPGGTCGSASACGISSEGADGCLSAAASCRPLCDRTLLAFQCRGGVPMG